MCRTLVYEDKIPNQKTDKFFNTQGNSSRTNTLPTLPEGCRMPLSKEPKEGGRVIVCVSYGKEVTQRHNKSLTTQLHQHNTHTQYSRGQSRQRQGATPYLIAASTDLPGLLCRELDASLALDERCGDLHDHRLDGVGRAPALLGEELHADSAPDQHVATADDRLDYTHEWGLEGVHLLWGRGRSVKGC